MDLSAGNTSLPPAVAHLAHLATSGDRNGCLSVIPNMSAEDINTPIQTLTGVTFLMRAIELQETAVMKSLLEHGADVSTASSSGETPWSIALSVKNTEILAILAEHITPSMYPRAVHDMLCSGCEESEIVSLLLLLLDGERGSEWRAAAEAPLSCLHLASTRGLIDVVRLLLTRCEDSLRSLDDAGDSPLQAVEAQLVACRINCIRRRCRMFSQLGVNDHMTENDDDTKSITIASTDTSSGSNGSSTSDDSSSGSSSSSASDDESDIDEDEDSACGGSDNSYWAHDPSEGNDSRLSVGPDEIPLDENWDSARIERCQNVLMLLSNAMGVESSLLPSYGLTHSEGWCVLIRQHGVFPLLELLSRDFKTSSWEISSFMSTNDNPSSSEMGIITSNVSEEGPARRAATGRRSNGESKEGGDDDEDGGYTDPGFDPESDEMIPFAMIALEAARIYGRSIRPPRQTVDSHLLPLLNEDHNWRTFFNHPCNSRTLRALMWCLLAMHPSVKNKHIRLWAHIIQELTTLSLLEAEKEMRESLGMSSSNGESPLDVRNFSRWQKALFPEAAELSRDVCCPSHENISPACGSEKQAKGKRQNRWDKRSSRSKKIPSYYNSFVIVDVSCDPLPGLCHPAVAALIFERLSSLGFSLLFGITGQVVDSKGIGLDNYEEEMFDALLELLLCVLVPRLPAIHRLICMEMRSTYKVTKSTQKKIRKKKRNNEKRRSSDITMKNELGKASTSTSPESTAVECAQPIENHSVYRRSVGVVSVSTVLQEGGVLYPGEFPLIPGGRAAEKNKTAKVNVSLLRYVAGVLCNEIMGVWHGVDQMLSLLMASVDDGGRLATLLRGMYVWMVADDCTKVIPSGMRIRTVGRRDNKMRGGNTAHESGWGLMMGAASERVSESSPDEYKRSRRALARNGPDLALRYIAGGTHIAHTPSLFVDLCKSRKDGIACLVDSTSDVAEEGLLSSHLPFLLRVPWVLDDCQRLDYVVNMMESGVDDAMLEDSSSTEQRYQDFEIHLNRFTDPPVWAESVLQQLLLDNSKNLHAVNLSILYEGEAGVGPGPVKEFLEMCRVFFNTAPITSTSLTDMVEGERQILKQEPLTETSYKECGQGQSFNKKKKQRGHFSSVPLSTVFPLFRSSGDSHPECVVPVDLPDVVARIMEKTDHPPLVQRAEQDGSSAKNKGRMRRKQAQKMAISMFRCVGVLIGYYIRNCCPIGVGMPHYIWKILLDQQVMRSKGQARDGDYSGAITWQELCGSDESTCRSLGVILNDLSDDDLQAMDLTFVGTRLVWDVCTQSLLTQDVELVKDGAQVKVDSSNKAKYVNLYCRARSLSQGMEASLREIRTGLLRVIPQYLLNILSSKHIGCFLKGDSCIDVESLRIHVLYSNGYHANHRVIKLFWHLLEHSLSDLDLRNLLLFWTGNSVPPSGGFGGDDNEEMTISRMESKKPLALRSTFDPVNSLPEAQTCDKHLYLPEYKTLDEMKRAIKNALQFSCIGFDRP